MTSGTKIGLLLIVAVFGVVGGYFAFIPPENSDALDLETPLREPETPSSGSSDRSQQPQSPPTKGPGTAGRAANLPPGETRRSAARPDLDRLGGSAGDALAHTVRGLMDDSPEDPATAGAASRRQDDPDQGGPLGPNVDHGAGRAEELHTVILPTEAAGGGGKSPPSDIQTIGEEPGEDSGNAAANQPMRVRDPGRPSDVPSPPKYEEYTVRPGDTMTAIAQRWFGDARKWDLIAQANPFVDPERLKIGLTLRLPPRDAKRDKPDTSRRSGYIVKSGDTLAGIARAFYGDESKWDLIYEANRQTIGADPNRLKVGMQLRIPSVDRDD